MFFLMVEIDGVLTRMGRKTRKQDRAVERALELYKGGYRNQRVTYAEVWEAAPVRSRMAWSTQMAGLR